MYKKNKNIITTLTCCFTFVKYFIQKYIVDNNNINMISEYLLRKSFYYSEAHKKQSILKDFRKKLYIEFFPKIKLTRSTKNKFINVIRNILFFCFVCYIYIGVKQNSVEQFYFLLIKILLVCFLKIKLIYSVHNSYLGVKI